MLFGLPDSSDDEGYDSFPSSFTSEDEITSEDADKEILGPRSSLGQNIRAYLESSESEQELNGDLGADLDSEDEVILGLDGHANPSKVSTSKESVNALSHTSSAKAGESSMAWKMVKKSSARTEDLMAELRDEKIGGYDEWLRTTEQRAMRQGQQRASERRNELREVTMNARMAVQTEDERRRAQDVVDLAKMMKSIAIRSDKDDEEMQRKFQERQQRLWDDINAAINEAQRKEDERIAAAQAAAQAAARKRQEEEAARIAAEEKAALARRAEAERLAKEHMAKQQAEREAKLAAEKRAEEERVAKAVEEQKAAEATAEKERRARGGQAGEEWRHWVDKQKWMKKEVVEPVKGDRALRMGMRQGMRLITRGLGQVVNTQEGVLRVTNDIHNILSEKLPSPPGSSSPINLDPSTPPPVAYSYLLSHLSKALIKQAESEVAAKTEAAFPLGRIVIGLLLRGHAALGEVLFARLVKKCPWVVPHYPARSKDQSREEYEKSTGRGSDESLPDYISRMVGIVTLYFAILQTPLTSLIPTIPSPPTPDQLSVLIVTPFRFTAGWTWLASVLRDPLPGLPPVASMITTWIEVVGAEAMRLWGKRQVGKVLEAVMREGLQGGKVKGDSEAARQKLGLVLEGIGNLEHSKAREWEST